jgi:hypothetical protein
MKCPYCQSENVDYPTVNIGVGEQQCAPAGCMDCGAVQLYPDESPKTEEEKKTGWTR